MEKRRGKAQRIPRGGADIATCRKAKKSIHFTLRARKNALARPMLYNGAAVLGACLKRTIPTNIGNSFKEKLEGNPRRLSISLDSSPPFQPLTFLEQEREGEKRKQPRRTEKGKG